MDTVNHPLELWANGGYPMVMRELKCTKTRARHRVHAKIAEFRRRTNDPLWGATGNHGYAQLRRAIMENRVLERDLR